MTDAIGIFFILCDLRTCAKRFLDLFGKQDAKQIIPLGNE
jgi:hypothetical protein